MAITDAFNRADGTLTGQSTDTGETWEAGTFLGWNFGSPASPMSISGNQVTTGYSGYSVVNTGVQDGTVQATYKAGNWVALIARESVAGLYRVEWGDGGLGLQRDTSGTQLASAAATMTAGKVLSLTAETVAGPATKLTVKVDGVTLIDYTDSSGSQRTGTRFGLGVTGGFGSFLDDFSFAPVGPTPATVALTGSLPAKTASFQLATVASMALTGVLPTKTGAFTVDAPSDVRNITLGGVLPARTATFSADAVASVALSGTLAPKTASFTVTTETVSEGTASLALAGQLPQKVATFVARAVVEIVPTPAHLRQHGPAPVVIARALGAPTMTGLRGTQPTYSVSKAMTQRARQQIVADGVDITFLRGVRVPDVSCTLLSPLRYGPGQLDLPQVVAGMEPLGDERADDLAWMWPGAPIEVNLVLDDPAGIDPPTMLMEGFYKGVLVAWDLDGRNVSIELGGEANGRAAMRDRQPVIFPRVNDIGHQISDAVKDLGVPVFPPLGTDTGIEVMTTGGVGHLEHIQNLCAQAWTRQGKYWTIMPNAAGAYQVAQKSDSTRHATVFFDDSRTVAKLRRDLSAEHNRIFVTGVTPNGQRVRFGVYPGLIQGPTPDFPGHLESGDSGDGVRLLIRKLQQSNYLGIEDVVGGYDFDVVEAVKDLQDDAGLPKTGEVNEATWAALYDLGVTAPSLIGAHIEPAAQDPRVRRVNRSANGTVLEFNDDYDPTVLVADRTIDAGVGKTRNQLREFARTVLETASAPNWVGDITFNTGALLRGERAADVTVNAAMVMEARELIPTMNLWAPRFEGGTRFNVSALQVAADGTVTATVDTRFRDALEVWEIIDRNRESKNDPARRRNMAARSSTIGKDSIGEWDEFAGMLGLDVPLEGGRWTGTKVIAAMEGQVAWIRAILEDPAEFAIAVFARPGGTALLNDVNPEPLAAGGAKKWQTHDDALQDHGILFSAGTPDEPCGYSKGRKADGDPLTGRFLDDAGFRYWAEDRCQVYVAIWVAEDNVLPAGRIMRAQLESGA